MGCIHISFMSKIAIEFHNVGKMYRLGRVGTGTLSHDLNRWWQTSVLGKEDPYLKIGQTNDRTRRGLSDYVWALRDVSFNVEQGEVLGIIGNNGAGKSTLLKLLSHITSPTTGSISYEGRIASLLEVGTGFHPELTGRENIYMNGSILGMRKAEIDRKLDEIVDFAGVERYLDTPVKRFSSGMIVRLGFSVAAFLEPEILVVDEVLTVGDAEFQKKAIGKMDEVARGEGRTVLFVSHNMGAVKSLCTRGVLLNKGELAYEGDILDTVEAYMQSNMNIENSHIVDAAVSILSSFHVNRIVLNGTEQVESTIGSEQEYLDLHIEGRSDIPLNGDVKMIFKTSDGIPLASFNEGRVKGITHTFSGSFVIDRRIQLPRYLSKGDLLVDIMIHEPKRRTFLRASNCAILHVEGSCDAFATPIIQKYDGILGLESVAIR